MNTCIVNIYLWVLVCSVFLKQAKNFNFFFAKRHTILELINIMKILMDTKYSHTFICRLRFVSVFLFLFVLVVLLPFIKKPWVKVVLLDCQQIRLNNYDINLGEYLTWWDKLLKKQNKKLVSGVSVTFWKSNLYNFIENILIYYYFSLQHLY